MTPPRDIPRLSPDPLASRGPSSWNSHQFSGSNNQFRHPNNPSHFVLCCSRAIIFTIILLQCFYFNHSLESSNLEQDSPIPGSRPPRIIVHPRNVTAFEKTTAILICEAESDPKPNFSWFKDGKPLNKRRMPIIRYGKGTVLRIEPLKSDRDPGEYECQVENGVGSAIRSQIQVKVIPETESPPEGFPKIITQPITTQTIEVGSTASIACYAKADPDPEYSWLHDSVPVDIAASNNRIYIENGTLKINSINENDKGEYLCIASNFKGVVTSIATNLVVSSDPLPDAPPTDLRYKLTSPTDVTLTWSPPVVNPNVIITGYQLYIGKLGAQTSIKHDIPAQTRMAFNDLSDNTEYAFRVRAKSRGGYGQFSETKNFTTPKDAPPAPQNVRASADSYTSAMIWWDETAFFSGITGYRVYYTLYNQTALIPHTEDLDRWLTKYVPLTNSVIISNLQENSQYEVRVCVVGSNISGKLSNAIKFRSTPDEVPYDMKVSALTTHSAKLSWKAPLELVPSKYKLTYDAPEKVFIDDKGVKQTLSIPAKTVISPNTLYTLDDLTPHTKYRINVTALSAKEIFRPPATIRITTAKAAPKKMSEPTLIGPMPGGREFEVYLPWASEEFGDIAYYYVIIVPAFLPLHDADFYSTSDLNNTSVSITSNEPYIAAKFSKQRMVKRFVLGDNKTYEGYLNRPLNKDTQYHLFVRAVVEHSETLYTSSAMSDQINLSQSKPDIQSSHLPKESFKKVKQILISALALVLLLAMVVTLFYKKQRQALKTNQINETTIRLLPDHMIYSSVPIEPPMRNLNYESRAMMNHPPVAVTDLLAHIDLLKLNNNLKEEYESIEPGQQLTWEHSYLDSNRSKNRYGNVISYDHSRVVLSQIDGIQGSDYINANFCDGYNKSNQYIATQGPLPNTVGDFWRMVWEQRSRTIVMMTQLEERGRVKCVQYWPSRDSVTYHGITITALDGGVEELAYYSIRTFRLKFNNEIRDVRQFQFTAWPDHGVPDHPTPFLMFLRRIRVTNPSDAGPMIVLCSAGVGRTGCFIVIDTMIERIKHENTIDIYGHVTRLRAQRNYIVQTEDQYMFIHDAVYEAFISANTEVSISRLAEYIHELAQVSLSENATGLELEFKRLSSIRYSGQKFISANLPINKHKNRLMNILPYESSRVCLDPIAGVEGSDYINASFCDGYRLRNAYIATQSPLPHTTHDMWRMLIEHNSSVIVMLTQLKEAGREKCTQYWPAERYGDYGPYRVTLSQEFDSTFNYVLREFNVTDSRNPNYTRVIRQFHYLNWPEQGVPKSGESFINFIAEVHGTKQKFGIEGPITVHCSVGVGRTGVFISLSIILERLRNEGVLHLFETVRTLRTQRPGMVQTEDQYQFCYNTALEYVRSFDHHTR